MKKLVTLAFAVLLVGIVACQKQNAEPTQVVDSKTTARQIFEQQKNLMPKTKFGDVHDVVKPLPGDFTPLWEQAVEKIVGATTAVNVPIASAVSYTAVYPCENHSDADHQHHAISVVQKLAVVTVADNFVCYIENIVPSEECELTAAAINESFMYGESMAGFTGFAAYHNFDGTLSHIDRFDNGTKTATAQPGDAEQINDITAGVKLYPINASAARMNYLPQVECFICHDATCPAPNLPSRHCSACFKEYGKCNHGGDMNERCRICGHYICSCDTPPPPSSSPCPVCGVVNCGVYHPTRLPDCALCGEPHGYCSQYNDGRYLEEYVHAKTLLDLFRDIVSQSNMHYLQLGSRFVDREMNSAGDEYAHNLMLQGEDYNAAYNKLRNWFILKIQQHKTSPDLSRLGEALHPILDSYITPSERMAMADYFTYNSLSDIVSSGSPMSTKYSATMAIYNAAQSLPQYPTDAQVGAIFDNWANQDNLN